MIFIQRIRDICGLLIFCICVNMCALHGSLQEIIYDWAVVGGGPGGIVTIAALLEVGVDAKKILWIDAEFSVGSLGKYYTTVPANNKAKRLVEFLQMCSAISTINSPSIERLKSLNPELEYPLKYIVDPLQDITNHFLARVASVRGSLATLDFKDDLWNLEINNGWHKVQRVVLAIGSHPRHLNYGVAGEIPLAVALNKSELAQEISPHDTVAVIGGAHSAVLVMKFLYEIGAARIINFYRHPLYYLTVEQQALRACQPQGDPLSGMASAWAREVLEVKPPGSLIRIKVCDEALKAWLPLCTKIVYAAGFERNLMPTITGIPCGEFNGITGVIGTHLFGIGIAFPELIDKGEGVCSPAIGLRDFMRFAQRVVPEWMYKDISYEQYAPYDDIIFFTDL